MENETSREEDGGLNEFKAKIESLKQKFPRDATLVLIDVENLNNNDVMQWKSYATLLREAQSLSRRLSMDLSGEGTWNDLSSFLERMRVVTASAKAGRTAAVERDNVLGRGKKEGESDEDAVRREKIELRVAQYYGWLANRIFIFELAFGSLDKNSDNLSDDVNSALDTFNREAQEYL